MKACETYETLYRKATIHNPIATKTKPTKWPSDVEKGRNVV